MREYQTPQLFVVDREQKLYGAVEEEAAAAAVAAGTQDLSGILDDQVVSVHQHTYLTDLLALSAETPNPLAVVDDERRVVGVLARDTVLQALGQHKAKPQTDGDRPSQAREADADSALAKGAAR